MERNLADIRREYSLQELSRDSVATDPFVQFGKWFDEYVASGPLEPSACTLSTVGSDGAPSSRVVLLKGFDNRGFVFFTNYESNKGRDLTNDPRVAMHFFWPELERQVEITGLAEKTSREESEAYFASRPTDSKLGAWASKQSSPLESRDELTQRFAEMETRFDGDVPCPDFWGGFRVVPTRFEYWQGRRSRLHDRIRYEHLNGDWKIARLYP
ncbi:MAG TPA: pyridoxamine 5'-phosphate oxidase [Pyrinomonadaceae bacterium]|nr:pyridoxamine 5'-phosphate oxidase [Pyrinomonadaceae bacterium]